MALSHAVEHQFAVFIGRGVVTAGELQSGLAAVLTTSRLAERPRLLFDLRDADSLELAPDDLDALCRVLERAGPAAKEARFAIVADTDSVLDAALQFQEVTLALPIEVRVFRQIDAARGWLAHAELGM